MKNNNFVKVTVLSAVTILTFAGAIFVIPNTANAKNSSSEVKYFEIANKKNDFFEKFQEKNIDRKVKKIKRWNLNSEVLEYLGITRSEAIEAKMAGKSFKDIAEEKNLDVSELSNIFEDNLVDKINLKLKEGRISQERYNKIINNLDSVKQKFLEGSFNK